MKKNYVLSINIPINDVEQQDAENIAQKILDNLQLNCDPPSEEKNEAILAEKLNKGASVNIAEWDLELTSK